MPAYLATAGRTRPTRNTLDRLTVLHAVDDRPPNSADSAPSSPHAHAAETTNTADTAEDADGGAAGAERPERAGRSTPHLRPEERRLLELLRQGPLSLAEAAAHLRLPVSVLRVLVADLVDAGRLRTRAPVPHADLPDRHILEKVLDGLRTLKPSR